MVAKAKYSTTCLNICATPKYYHPSLSQAPMLGCGVKRKPHKDPEVQIGYMHALGKLVLDEEEHNTIQQQLSHHINCNHVFGLAHPNRD
jgi:hypothetical protein